MILKALWRVNKTTVLYCIISVTIAFSRVRTGQKDSQTQRYRRIFVLKTEKSPFQTKMDTYVRSLIFGGRSQKRSRRDDADNYAN